MNIKPYIKTGLSIDTLSMSLKFNSAIKKDNIAGLQFHPERSGDAGIYLLSKIISQITDGL